MGKDLNSDDVRKQLGAYSRNKNIQEKFPETSQKITNLLEELMYRLTHSSDMRQSSKNEYPAELTRE